MFGVLMIPWYAKIAELRTPLRYVLTKTFLSSFFWIFWKLYHAIIFAKLHVYRHSYQDFWVYRYHMESHDTFAVQVFSSVTWQLWAIPDVCEITSGRIPPTTSGLDHMLSCIDIYQSWAIMSDSEVMSVCCDWEFDDDIVLVVCWERRGNNHPHQPKQTRSVL